MNNTEAAETLRQMIQDWNKLTDEQRAEAQAIAAEQAASRYAEVLFNRAIGLDLNWATGEFERAR
jgi:hypothetical protein